MKDVAIWVLILAGPILAFLAMRRHRVQWSATFVVVALVTMAAVCAVGFTLLLK